MAGNTELTKTRIHAGHWEGILHHPSAEPAPLTVTYGGTALDAPEVKPIEGSPAHSQVRVRIPAELLGEGAHSFLITDQRTGAQLAHFSIISGDAVEDDLRSELSLLRAELDMLKKAFRRHFSQSP